MLIQTRSFQGKLGVCFRCCNKTEKRGRDLGILFCKSSPGDSRVQPHLRTLTGTHGPRTQEIWDCQGLPQNPSRDTEGSL